MTPTPESQALRVAIAADLGVEQLYAVEKQGFYYRPNGHGYTSSLLEAGQYTKADAERELCAGEIMSIVPLPLPNYTECRDAIVSAVLGRFRTGEEKFKFTTALWLEMQETLDLLAFGEQNTGAIAFAVATADALTLARAYCAAAGISVEGAG